MALFSLGSVLYGGQNTTSDRSLGLDYGYNIMKFPSDIGSMDKGHYMVIHINKQRKSGIDTANLPDLNAVDKPSVMYTRKLNPTDNTFSKKEKEQTLSDIQASDQFFKKFGTIITGSTLLRTIVRTTDTIVLYMPDTLNFTHNQHYGELQLGGTTEMAAISSGVSFADTFKDFTSAMSGNSDVWGKLKAGGAYAFKNLSPFISNVLKQLSTPAYAGFTAFMGMVQNPMIEMIYTSPALRTFAFEFMIYPRDENEALEAQKILEVLRFHQSPELSEANGGYFIIPPSEFDIFFYYNGKENVNLPAISTCVLETIDIDYAPNGFSAYEVVGDDEPKLGKTGMPVGIRLRLQFKETEIMTKSNYTRDF